MSQTYDVSLNPEKSIIIETEISGGTTDYERLKNLPSINGVELKGDLSTEDLKIELPDTSNFATKEDLETKADKSEIPDVKEFATKIELEQATINKADKSEIPDVSGLATKDELNDYALKADVPKKTSDLINDSDFITSEAVKNTTKMLDDEHKNILLSNGTYDGKDVEDGFVFTSPDGKLVGFDKTLNPGGEAWKSIATVKPSSASNAGAYKSFVLYGNGIYLAVVSYLRTSNTTYYTYTATSTDGITWTKHTNLDWTDSIFTSGYQAAFATFLNDKFIILENKAGFGKYSFDGITWTDITLPTSNIYWMKGAYGNGTYLILSRGMSQEILKSEDGITWSSNKYLVNGDWRSICYGDNGFVAVGGGGYSPLMQVATSSSGNGFSNQTPPLDQAHVGDICFGNGKYVLTLGTKNYPDNRILYSLDGGISWETVTAPVSDGWNNVIYTGSMFIAVGSKNGYVITSEDGVNWVQGVSGISTPSIGQLCSHNNFVVGGIDNIGGLAYNNYAPFYEYGLTDLSYTKEEIDNQIGSIGFALDVLNGEVI